MEEPKPLNPLTDEEMLQIEELCDPTMDSFAQDCVDQGSDYHLKILRLVDEVKMLREIVGSETVLMKDGLSFRSATIMKLFAENRTLSYRVESLQSDIAYLEKQQTLDALNPHALGAAEEIAMYAARGVVSVEDMRGIILAHFDPEGR